MPRRGAHGRKRWLPRDAHWPVIVRAGLPLCCAPPPTGARRCPPPIRCPRHRQCHRRRDRAHRGRFPRQARMNKGTMALIDEPRAEAIYASMGPAIEISGGSGANTIAGVASFGARAAFVGKVKDDTLGKAFTHDIRAAGVAFTTPPASDGPSTARCYVLVTPDGERTMNTYLGAAQNLTPADLDEKQIAAARHHLSGRLSVGSAAREGSLPQGRDDRARRGPQGRADAVGCVLRRPLSRRIPQPDAHRRGRSDLRQRERTEEPVPDRRFRHRRRRRCATT